MLSLSLVLLSCYSEVGSSDDTTIDDDDMTDDDDNNDDDNDDNNVTDDDDNDDVVADDDDNIDTDRGMDALNCPARSEEALQRDIFEQTAVAAVDVLWVIDNSGSMQEEQAKLAPNFNTFISYLLQTNVHYHVGVVSTDTSSVDASGKLHCPASNPSIKFISDEFCKAENCAVLFKEMVELGIVGSPIEKGLQAGMMALTPPNIAENYSECGSAPNGCFYRPEANLAVIVVSDEEDSSIGDKNYYKRFFEGLKGYGNDDMISVSAIAGNVPNGCFTGYVGSSSTIGTVCMNNATCGGGSCIGFSATQGFCTIRCSNTSEWRHSID